MKRLILVAAACLVFFASKPTFAQEFSYQNQNRQGVMAIDAAIGFMLDPDEFLLAFGGDYFLAHNWSLGPLMQFGLGDNFILMAPSLQVKGILDLPERGFLERVKPFGQVGFGFAYANLDTPVADDDDISFMFNFGLGVDIYLTNRLALGNNMLFNILPTELFNDRFIFSWQFLSVKYHF